jgi:uncharacterized protein (TIGR02996 family)
MTPDEAFIRAILADPDDPAARLVYADWLDEQDDPRGEFLRAEARLAAISEDDAARSALTARLRELRAGISPDWLARLDRTRIENCEVRFEFLCPRQWQQLQPTQKSAVRYCDTCKQNVFYCRTVEEARSVLWHGRCIAIESHQERREGDLTPRRVIAVGRPSRESIQFSLGAPVTIRSGRWAGEQGLVEKADPERRRAIVQVPIDGVAWKIELGFDELIPEPVAERHGGLL